MSGLNIQPDGSDEVIAAGLDPEEIDELREWFCRDNDGRTSPIDIISIAYITSE